MERSDSNFHDWRARFTFEHYGKPGFKGGFLRQWDGAYSRAAASVDYTPGTLKEVIDRFMAWCDVGYMFPTVEVRLAGKGDKYTVVRKFDPEGRREPIKTAKKTQPRAK